MVHVWRQDTYLRGIDIQIRPVNRYNGQISGHCANTNSDAKVPANQLLFKPHKWTITHPNIHTCTDETKKRNAIGHCFKCAKEAGIHPENLQIDVDSCVVDMCGGGKKVACQQMVVMHSQKKPG